MARLGKSKIKVYNKKDKDCFIQVEFVIFVNKEGYFTTTLNESDVRMIKSYNVDLYSNSRANSRDGFFTNKTKQGLLVEIKDVLEKCVTRTMTSEEIVIRYSFATVAAFGFTVKGDIVPNLSWSGDGELDMDAYWQSGTVISHASKPHPIGVQMYVKPFYKRTYSYHGGNEKIEYDVMTAFSSNEIIDGEYNLRWLQNIVSTSPPRHGEVNEIKYTEQRAMFFVNMYKSLCKLAHNIAMFSSPEDMLNLIDSGKLLMQNDGHE